MKRIEKMSRILEFYLIVSILLCVVTGIFSESHTDRLININTAIILGGMLMMFMTLVRK